MRRWRRVIIYLVVFIFLGGYFYYFEVVKRHEREERKRLEKKVFHFEPDGASEVHLVRPNSKEIIIKKTGSKWMLEEPVKTEADQASVKGLVNVVADIEANKWLDIEKREALKNYGLDKPALEITVMVNGKTYSLRVGQKNPAGTGYYAQVAGQNRVFLMDTGRWGVLNKQLFDLRRKELVTFEDEDVKSLTIGWDNSSSVQLVREDGGWKCVGNPGMKIKNSKVENVLDQIRWMRARKFLSFENPNLKDYGLDRPKVSIVVVTGDDKKHEVLLAEPRKDNEKEAKNFLVAYTGDLPFVVYVDKDILNEIPKSPRDVEDRSVFVWKEEDIYKIAWAEGGKSYEVVKLSEDKWGIRIKDGEKPKEMKESWRVRSLFWELEDIEYDSVASSASSPPSKPAMEISFFDKTGKELGRWVWGKLPEDGEKLVPLWITEGGETKTVNIKAEGLKGVKEKVDNILKKFEQEDKKAKDKYNH